MVEATFPAEDFMAVDITITTTRASSWAHRSSGGDTAGAVRTTGRPGHGVGSS